MRIVWQFFADLALIALATVLAVALHYDLQLSPPRLDRVAPYLGFTLVCAAIAISALGIHRSIWRSSGARDYERIGLAVLLTVGGAMACAFILNRLEGVPRGLPLLQLAISIVLMAGSRAVARQVHIWRRSRTRGLHGSTGGLSVSDRTNTVLLIGINSVAELYIQSVADLGDGQVEIAGLLGRNTRHVGRRLRAHPVLGVPEDVEHVIRKLQIEGVDVDAVVIAIPTHKLSDVTREALSRLETEGAVELLALADQIGFSERTDKKPVVNAASTLRELEFSRSDLSLVRGRTYWPFKRAFDVVGSLVALVFASPFIAIGAVLVLIDLGLPIIFCQRRPGRFGRSFKVYKLRTMSDPYDANGLRLADDGRSSRIGQFLRRTRLDELPQLVNVLIGDMSLVGPRPLLPVDQDRSHKLRLLVRPGLTGLAQIAGGRDIAPTDKAAMDVWYVMHASLRLDFGVLIRTLPMVLFGDRVRREMLERALHDLREAGGDVGWLRDDLKAGAGSRPSS